MGLESCRILVVEDDYLIAYDVAGHLENVGAIVVGPAPSVGKAMRLIDSGAQIDAAVLDVNLAEENSFSVADVLQKRAIPFLFSTGYNSADIPAEWGHVAIAMKPLQLTEIAMLFRR